MSNRIQSLGQFRRPGDLGALVIGNVRHVTTLLDLVALLQQLPQLPDPLLKQWLRIEPETNFPGAPMCEGGVWIILYPGTQFKKRFS